MDVNYCADYASAVFTAIGIIPVIWYMSSKLSFASAQRIERLPDCQEVSIFTMDPQTLLKNARRVKPPAHSLEAEYR